MKYLITSLVLLTSLGSFAAIVNSAAVVGKSVVVDVTYGGGCREHKFKLKLNPVCLESFPSQCSANLIETVVNGPDFCEAIINKKIRFNIKKNNLSKDTYWTIIGDVDYTGQRSSATVLIQ